MRADLLPMAILQNPKKVPVIEELIQDYAKAPVKVVAKSKEGVVEVKAFTTYNLNKNLKRRCLVTSQRFVIYTKRFTKS